jgi:hypothetical protein
MKTLNHMRLFSHALRTALIIIAGFIFYELLVRLEKTWNLKNPENKDYHFYQIKIYKLIFIFIIDLLILYSIAIFFGIHH